MAAPVVPSSVGLGELSRLLDLTERRVNQLAKEGIIPRSTRGQYELIPAVHGYIKYLRAAANDGSLSLTDERTRYTRLQSDKAQLDLDHARGAVVEKADVIQRELAIKGALKRLPRSMAPRLVGLGAREIEAILTERLYDVFRSLAQRTE